MKRTQPIKEQENSIISALTVSFLIAGLKHQAANMFFRLLDHLNI